ncbi:MAG: FKBP-type peptidyl-prolyl cis-trans isomerase [Deltaproteobacteria bacterium]|nr:FKBP-type peptidyl-prolyl cis-trans isomerase [Deltaproteobacteria bacterium]
MDENQRIADGKVVSIHYSLTDEAGLVLYSTEQEDAMDFLQGAGNVVPGLEKALAGHQVGDHLQVVLAPEEAFGLRQGAGPRSVPRESFPAEAEVYPGLHFLVEDDDDVTDWWVVDVEDDRVVVDRDHPLAGLKITYDVEVVGVRDATPEETAQGHPEGAEWEDGCDDCDCCDDTNDPSGGLGGCGGCG